MNVNDIDCEKTGHSIGAQQTVTLIEVRAYYLRSEPGYINQSQNHVLWFPLTLACLNNTYCSVHLYKKGEK